jgi:hypothetical protein
MQTSLLKSEFILLFLAKELIVLIDTSQIYHIVDRYDTSQASTTIPKEWYDDAITTFKNKIWN